MGGMQALQWAVDYPERVASAIPIATTSRHSPQQIAFNHVGRAAILADPEFHEGDYYGWRDRPGARPVRGADGRVHHLPLGPEDAREVRRMRQLAAAKGGRGREVGRGDDRTALLDRIFGGRVPEAPGEVFVFDRRFDANSYLCITKAIDIFDLSGSRDGWRSVREGEVEVPDHLLRHGLALPTYQSQEIRNAILQTDSRGVPRALDDPRHDAFLIETRSPRGGKPG